MQKVRLQKVIAQAGVASRRAAEAMIQSRRVTVNGKVVTELGTRVDPERDEVCVDRQRVGIRQPHRYFLLYKPRGCVTTLKDPQGRRTVKDLLRNIRERVFPVGRLDYDAEGLLILTNDGALAHRLQHPRHELPKTYEVKVRGLPDEEALRKLRFGVNLEEGRTAPAEARILRRLGNACWLEIVLRQGWNRQIKRMGEAVGHPVVKIRRVRYGPLTTAGLKPGKWRSLTTGEVRRLYELVHLDRESGGSHEQKSR